MKKHTLFVILIILQSLPVFAQNIVVENRIWSEATFASEGNSVSTVHHFFSGDTVINREHYKFIYLKYSLDSSASAYQLYWFIREDNGKVIIHASAGWEEVLYDFNLQEGDTFFNDVEYTVDSIRTIDVQGELLKHLFLSWGNRKLIWVEKYGSFSGVLSPYGAIGGVIVVLCVHDQDKLVYQNKQYNTCSLNGEYTGIEESTANNVFLICPGNNMVVVNNIKEQKGVISFYTIDGKEVLKEPISTSSIQLCMPNTGIFIYNFQNENGEVQKGKIVVN